MKARALLLTLALGLLLAPRAAEAQQAKKVFRVGVLATASPRSGISFVAFAQRLRALGMWRASISSSSSGTRRARRSGFPTSRPSWFVSRSMS